MERTQDVDVLSEAGFPHLENSKFVSPNEKCPSAKVTDSLHQGSNSHSTKLGDAAYLNSRNAHLDNLYNSNLVRINSSPHNCESNAHTDFDGKSSLSKFTGSDLMRHAGIGRGKHRERIMPVNDMEINRLKSQHPEYNMNMENSAVSNSIDFPELKSVKIVSDLEMSKVAVSPVTCSESANVNDVMSSKGVHEHAKLIDTQFRDGDMKNIHNTIDQYSREHDYRRMQNGYDSNKGGKGKPYRLSRFHNNGGASVQYKYDPRPMQHFPMANNVKPPRTMKGNEGYFRQNDSRRNQSSKPPFPSDMDKIMYSKPRPNMCSEKDIPGYSSNRNYVHNYPINKAEINSLVMPESYVARDLSTFKRRSYVNKIDHVNNSKQWTNNRIYSDYNGPSASCHRSAVAPSKSFETKHPSGCLSQEKNANNCAFVSKNDSRDPQVLEQDECSNSCDKEPGRLKANCSPCHLGNKQYSASHGSVNLCIDNNSNLGSATNFPTSASDKVSDPNYSHYRSLRDGSLMEKSGHYTSGQLSCDSQCEQLSSHPKNNECISIPDQPSVGGVETMQCPAVYNTLNCSPGAMSVAQASYADIIRSSAVGPGKVSLSQVFHSTNGIPKTEVTSALVQDVPLSKEHEQSSSSSEWIISRLSQANVNPDNIHSINGMSHIQNNTSIDGMHPRPIAVSVEKPSFYNTSLGVSKGLSSLAQHSSLSSPEKRVLECQLVEEHLCSLFASKKLDEKKISSESPAAPISPGEHSNNTACANVRTDSIFSDSSSVCSSSSSIFKTEMQQHAADVKEVPPPVVIMKNCMPSSNVSDISFGIEMDEIIQICSDNSKTDSSSVSDSDLSLSKSVNTCSGEKDAERSVISNNVDRNVLILGGKRLLWQEPEMDTSRCNLGYIVDFLQNAWHRVDAVADADGKESSDVIKYYSAE